jgi:hypothetical protein
MEAISIDTSTTLMKWFMVEKDSSGSVDALGRLGQFNVHMLLRPLAVAPESRNRHDVRLFTKRRNGFSSGLSMGE